MPSLVSLFKVTFKLSNAPSVPISSLSPISIDNIKFSSELAVNPKTGQQLVIYSEGDDFLDSYEFPDEIIMNWCPVSKYEV